MQEITDESVYTERLNEKGLKIILKYKFDPAMWLRFYEKYAHNPSLKRLMRCMVQIGTIDACLSKKKYQNEKSWIIFTEAEFRRKVFPN